MGGYFRTIGISKMRSKPSTKRCFLMNLHFLFGNFKTGFVTSNLKIKSCGNR